MRVQDFLLPDLGEGLQDATITSWSVAVGDEVTLNQTLCTVETNKADVEIPSPYSGHIIELGGGEGETLDVGSVLVRFATEAAAAPVNDAERAPVLVGYGADGDMDNSRRSPAVRSNRPRAKPPTRKLAAELNVDLKALTGSTPEGMISREDVLAAAGGPSSLSPDLVAVRGVQAEMAHRMTQSRNAIPDAHARVHVDGTGLLRLRDRMRNHTDDEAPITPFVLTLRLLTIALRRHPRLNASWVDALDGPQIHQHRAVHLGLGVATPRGLLVPVVSNAHDNTTRELAGAVAQLIREAREGTLKPAQLQGSTFTVSNFGAMGLDDGVPVINFPEAAILGIGSLKPRAIVVDGEVAARPTMTLTCAFDHRIIDGAQAAAFLCDLRDLIESPELALLDI